MSKANNSQSFQISGSSGVTIGGVHQTVSQTDQAVPQEESEPAPVKMLFLASNPLPLFHLQLDREMKAIQEALSAPGAMVKFHVEQSWAASYRDLQDGLLRHRPEILHWSGHGNRDGALLFDEDRTERELVRPNRPQQDVPGDASQALGRLFSVARGSIRCVVLNACHSEASARAVAEHVDCVIGMAAAVRDTTAIEFSWAFYHALALGQSVRAAFQMASARIGLEGLKEDRLPQLFASRSRPEEVFFGG